MSGRSIVAFAGHMIDKPDRAPPRFPAHAEGAAAEAVRARLDEWDAAEGVCSLACGGDIIFAEAMLARGGAVRVILPISVDEFLRESVSFTRDVRWAKRFQRVRARCASFEVYGDEYLAGSGTPFYVATLLIDGHAQLRARALGCPARTLAVWDGKRGDGLGGSASFVGHAVMQGREVSCIDPADARVFTPGAEAIRAAVKHSWARLGVADQTLEHRLSAVLFADIRAFSRLKEPKIPGFVREALGAVKRAVANTPPMPRVVNTWGDGVFVVTDDPEHAARLGLALVREAATIDHAATGADRPIMFRVGLHAGPTFVGLDPVTGRHNAYGADVNLAARIEPVVTPGEVWCSRAFAALTAAMGGEALRFECLGERELAKGAGAMEVWRVGHAVPEQ